MEMLMEAKGWIKFLGWLEVIGGILAFFAQFPVGIITGALAIISGVFLIGAANAIEIRNEMGIGENLRKYFILQGVVSLIGIALAVFVLLGIGLISMAG